MRRNPNAIAVTGISGVGKDFLIEKATCDLQNAKIYSTNEEIGKIMIANGIDFTQLSVHDNLDQYAEMANMKIADQIEKTPKNSNIINTHITHPRRGGLYVDQNTLETLVPRDLVMIKADPSTIQSRRRTDLSRNRREEPKQQLLEQQVQEENVAQDIAKRIGSRITTLINEEPYTEQNAKTLHALAQSPFLDTEKEYKQDFFNKDELAEKILHAPNARIPLDGYLSDESLESTYILNNMPSRMSELGKANFIYNFLCRTVGYDEQSYLRFNSTKDLLHIYREHLSIDRDCMNNNQQVVCQEIAIKLAELIKSTIGRIGYLENYTDPKVRGGKIPHTTYVVQLKDDADRIREVVFDPFQQFSTSDSVIARGLHEGANVLDSQKERQDKMEHLCDRIIGKCQDTDSLVLKLQQTLNRWHLPSVERSTLIKAVIKFYTKKMGITEAYDRFAYFNNGKEQLISVFQINDNKNDATKINNFIVIGDHIFRIKASTLARMEQQRQIKHISRHRHVNFDCTTDEDSE